MSQVRDREFWQRFGEEMRAEQAEFEARFAAATRRKEAALKELRRELGEREPHTVDIAWNSVRCALPTSTSGAAGQILGVDAQAAAPARKRKRWRWF